MMIVKIHRLTLVTRAIVGVGCIALVLGVDYPLAKGKGASGGLFEIALTAKLKTEFKLKSLTRADPKTNAHASGVIVKEDEKEGYLVLLTHDVCKNNGASGRLFVNPYSKTKLDEPANCDGKRVDRYRVEQK